MINSLVILILLVSIISGLMSYYWVAIISGAIGLVGVAVLNHLQSARYSRCKICGKEPSKTGNYTNMLLSGISGPRAFNRKWGMMCADHAMEVTERIMSERGLAKRDFDKALAAATAQLNKDLNEIVEKAKASKLS